jgi:hypothetical protein
MTTPKAAKEPSDDDFLDLIAQAQHRVSLGLRTRLISSTAC